MKVDLFRLSDHRDCREISARVACERPGLEPFECWVRFPARYRDCLADSADIFLAMMLLPAMMLGETLRIEGPVTAQLLRNCARLQEIYRRWVPGSQIVPILVSETRETRDTTTATGVGCFFSGGVDSFYSLVKHQDEVTHLVLISGFDKGLRNPRILEKTRAALDAVAAACGKQPLEVATNVRQFTDLFVDWGLYHGGVLGGVAVALARGFSTFIVPSSYAYDQLHPWGSHPLLDPLWCIPGLEVVHDGCEVTRYEKVARISKSDLALAHLRVCWVASESNNYNCGKCEKCLRTMLGLYLNGALSKCRTFTTPLSPRAFRKVRIKRDGQVAFTEENLRELALREGNFDKSLYRALRWAVRRGQIKRGLKALVGVR